METYQSKYSAEDLDNTIGLVHGLVVPHVGDNGNWFVGETDTGVFAKGIDVTGAAVGQIVKVTEIDENGRPLAWEAVDFAVQQGVFEKVAEGSLTRVEGVSTYEFDLPEDALGMTEFIFVMSQVATATTYQMGVNLDGMNVGSFWGTNNAVNPNRTIFYIKRISDSGIFKIFSQSSNNINGLGGGALWQGSTNNILVHVNPTGASARTGKLKCVFPSGTLGGDLTWAIYRAK